MTTSGRLRLKLQMVKDLKKPIDYLLEEYNVSKKYDYKLIEMANTEISKYKIQIELLNNLIHEFQQLEKKKEEKEKENK